MGLTVNIENERATWTKIELSGKKDVTKKKKDNDEDPDEEASTSMVDEEDGVTKVVEDGAFTITSTVGLKTKEPAAVDTQLEGKFGQLNLFKGPSPRFGAQLAIKQGS